MKGGRQNKKSYAIYFLLGLIVIGIGCCYEKNKSSFTKQAYEVGSHDQYGYSALYTTLEKMGLKVKKGYIPISQVSLKDCQIILESHQLNEEEVKDWIDQGGMLVLIRDEKVEGVKVIEEGRGILVQVASRMALTNSALMENSNEAYDLYLALMAYGEGRQIIFNGYPKGVMEQEANLWDVIPDFIKVLLIQSGLIIVLFILYKGKRFGKAECLIEEVERGENEYLYAAAELFRQAEAWDVVLEQEYHKLENMLQELSMKETPFLTHWHEEGLPEEKRAAEVAAYMNKKALHQNKKIKKDEAMHVLGDMAHLMKLIDQRRKQYWEH